MNSNLMTTIANVQREITTRQHATPHLRGCARRQNVAAIQHAEDRLTDLLVEAAQAGLIRDMGDDSPASRVARWMAMEVAA